MESLCCHSHEELVRTLQTSTNLKEYQKVSAHYSPHWLPAALGGALVFFGNLLYGKKPSYGKFKAIEVVARIPYQSWEVVSYMLLTFFYTHEQKAIALAKTSRFSREAQDNETMHVIVISQLAKKYNESSFVRHTVIPILFSFGYFAASFLLYLIRPRYSYQLNYLFESHAFLQYQEFLAENEAGLRNQPLVSEFLALYGRTPRSEYEFFTEVMIDELIHRNQSYSLAEAEK